MEALEIKIAFWGSPPRPFAYAPLPFGPGLKSGTFWQSISCKKIPVIKVLPQTKFKTGSGLPNRKDSGGQDGS
jgi:hypothetical protein